MPTWRVLWRGSFVFPSRSWPLAKALAVVCRRMGRRRVPANAQAHPAACMLSYSFSTKLHVVDTNIDHSKLDRDAHCKKISPPGLPVCGSLIAPSGDHDRLAGGRYLRRRYVAARWAPGIPMPRFKVVSSKNLQLSRPGRTDYSCRRATIGSTFIARRAGMVKPVTAAAIRRMAENPNVDGSRG